ncbi:MAG TPA: AAA family ATPase [Candidatus Bathyarchaeia archaeon]|nr:AAA family ATPase [Candidatus Bathyarchaeia archaeon]
MQNNRKILMYIFASSFLMCSNVQVMEQFSSMPPIKVEVSLSKDTFGNTEEQMRNMMTAVVKGWIDGMDQGIQENIKKVDRSTNKVTAATIGSFIKTIGLSFGIGGFYASLGVAAMATGYYGTRTLWNYIEQQLKKPRVIIDKKAGLWYRAKQWFSKEKPDAMILDPRVEEYLQHSVQVTKIINSKIKKGEKDIFYRNMLLAGPPGTGKTMFARQISKAAGMESVEVTGSSFFQEGAGITAVDELFRWANSGKGLVIFIDEADSLLPDRTQVKVGTEEYRIINHFLNYLGNRSNKFMVVMATNHAIVFDEAMERRFDDYIEMPLPDLKTRAKVLQLYRDTLLIKARAYNKAFVDSVKTYLADATVQKIAQKTEGFSNGHLQGIINAIKTDADATKNGLVTGIIIEKAVERYITKHNALAKHTMPLQSKNHEYATGALA